MCPFVPCEYPNPIEIETYEAFADFNLDAIVLPDFWSSQALLNDIEHFKQSESPQSTRSADQVEVRAVMTDKKTGHNASERDRRKKINSLYSSLRALLPDTDHKKKLSIPVTVARVLKYIPELQKEVKGLTHRKEELLSKTSISQQRNTREFIEDEKPTKGIIHERSSPFSVFVNKLSDKEMMIQISAFERISFSELLLVLEESGYHVVDVSSIQSFGGKTFYYIHLWIEGTNVMNYGKLNQELQTLCQLQKKVYL